MTVGAAVAVVERLRPSVLRAVRKLAPAEVLLLETPSPAEARRVATLERAGIRVRIPDFFAGHLVSPDGDSVWVAAARLSLTAAPLVADRLIGRSPTLSAINADGRRGAFSLHLAKTIYASLHRLAVRIEVARALAAPARPVVWVEMPADVPVDALKVLAPDLRVIPVRTLATAKAAMRPFVKEVFETMRGVVAWPGAPRIHARPTILTVHEEDLHSDRSRRGQLHWRAGSPEIPACRVALLPQRGGRLSAESAEELARRDIVLLNHGDVRQCLHRARHPMQRKLKRWSWACTRQIFGTRDPAMIAAAGQGLYFVRTGRRIGAAAEVLGARAWVSCEPYFVEADAVNLVAAEHGIRTAAWQYSTVARATFIMVTQADVTATFSESFEEQFTLGYLRPVSVVPMGYPYGDVPALVRDRSLALRQELRDAGARFVIAFFDESAARTKWHGLISPGEHRGHLETLAAAVLADPTLAVILKPKYVVDRCSGLYADSEILRRAEATGRFRELTNGIHRNVIFASEAALASDIAIGLLAGASAVAESAVVGTRGLLLRLHGEHSRIESLLDGVDVIYPSVDDALRAVEKYRVGDPTKTALGDWTPVVRHFDGFRDDRAPERLRKLIESWALGSRSPRDADVPVQTAVSL